jgi:hypothetical protein
MKKYTKQIEVTKNRLVIEHDENAENPRKNCDNLGYFITVDRNYNSPDRNETIERIIKDTGQEANSQDEHIKMITELVQEQTGEHVEAIYPVVKYEHIGVVYRLGTKHGFDYGNNGFYIITTETQKAFGTPKESFEKVIAEELENYTKWANGEVYQFTLYDKNGEIEDSCSGFYSIDDIKEYLPKEWENESLLEYAI